MSIRILHSDCLDILPTLSDIDACVTDPPYHLTSVSRNGSARINDPATPFGRTALGGDRGFMGKTWDGGDIASRSETWRLVLNALKPGAHLLTFGGTRTSHRMASAIEDAGFEIRDTLMWMYGQGFPKSLDVSKAIDKTAGAEREVVGFDENKYRPNRDKYLLADQPGGGGKLKADNGATQTAPATPEAAAWSGWGTALKPAFEPIILARKPLQGTVAANVLAHGTGAINVDACRVAADIYGAGLEGSRAIGTTDAGRWPANVIHDGSDEVLAAFAAFGKKTSGGITHQPKRSGFSGFDSNRDSGTYVQRDPDTGTAARFFYSAKATAADRADSRHPTVKPLSLMRWLVRLITPPGGTVLDPFAGSGTTGEAAVLEGFHAVLIEREAEYIADIRRRIGRSSGGDTPLFAVA